MPNTQWTAFCSLLDIDSTQPANSGSNAVAASNLKAALSTYMQARFGTNDITYLVDIINSQVVVDAIVTNLTNIANDNEAIRAAISFATRVISTAKEIIHFSFDQYQGVPLVPTILGTIDEQTHFITANVPSGADITALVATYIISAGASIAINTVPQISGVTANDFSYPVTYTITAEDLSTQDYIVILEYI
jgi:hypothetical protein